MQKRTIFAALAITTALAITGTSGAVAGSLITGKDIRDGSVRKVDLGSGVQKTLKNSATKGQVNQAHAHINEVEKSLTTNINDLRKSGVAGPKGDAGADGKDAFLGAVKRVANYTNGGGGIATVSCGDTEAVSQQYTAISGGVYAKDTVGTDNPVTTDTLPITGSFPGRMDWSKNQPKADRMDGWVITFGESAHGNKVLQVWALCVPNVALTNQVTNY